MNNEPVTLRYCYGRDVYIWLSFALLVPVFLLPLRLAFSAATPAFGVMVEARWLLLAGSLLLVAVAADSTLHLLDRYRQQGRVDARLALFTAMWVTIPVLMIPYVTSSPSHGWWLPALFIAHAWRAGSLLWRDGEQWWLWYAWWRDATAAMLLFFWLAFWPAY